jgi:ABC-type glutathione transport system ATPase component
MPALSPRTLPADQAEEDETVVVERITEEAEADRRLDHLPDRQARRAPPDRGGGPVGRHDHDVRLGRARRPDRAGAGGRRQDLGLPPEFVSLLRLQDLTKRFAPDDLPAVDGLSLAVAPGEILALLGPSGCGKTTTLRLIAGFDTPDRGVIEIRGQCMSTPGMVVPPEARGVGIVFQEYALFPHLSVGDNVAFGLGRFDRTTRPAGRRGAGAGRSRRLAGPPTSRGRPAAAVALARALPPPPP